MIGRMMGRMIGKGDAAAVFSPIARDRSGRPNHFRAFTRYKAAARPPDSFPAASAPAARQATIGCVPPASRFDGHPAVNGRLGSVHRRLEGRAASRPHQAGPVKPA